MWLALLGAKEGSFPASRRKPAAVAVYKSIIMQLCFAHIAGPEMSICRVCGQRRYVGIRMEQTPAHVCAQNVCICICVLICVRERESVCVRLLHVCAHVCIEVRGARTNPPHICRTREATPDLFSGQLS